MYDFFAKRSARSLSAMYRTGGCIIHRVILAAFVLSILLSAVAARAIAAESATKPAAAGEKTEESQRQKIFRLLDKDDDEFLNLKEYTNGTLGKAFQAKELEFKSFDRNGDEKLDVIDFEFRGKEPPPKRNGPPPRVVFDALDTTGDDLISHTEFTSQRPKDQWAIELLDELLGDVCPPKLAFRNAFFHRFDSNSDEQLDWEEFRTRGKDKVMDSMARFLQHDVNRDSKVSSAEYATVRKFLSQGRWSVPEEFELYDVQPVDGFLSAQEFQFAPAAAPDLTTRFHGKDLDHDLSLSSEEMLVFLPERAWLHTLNQFSEADKDASGGLSLSEYLGWKEEQRQLMLAKTAGNQHQAEGQPLDRVSQWILFADGIGMLCIAGFFSHRAWRRRKCAVRNPMEATVLDEESNDSESANAKGSEASMPARAQPTEGPAEINAQIDDFVVQ
ncbi:hypothetical protein [Rubinisphaera margarita]|uniref:hypothetical protein n=1 Tax=Rubinisphaera margarita TaxID=2909586 RepID=UPI001EE95058|nr:hypothetical protein [Rubinisphaera margarita]MCG6157249.1 hypothetical protein [Rubinisphaera margarita]